jgi:HAD superfamily hydrolase (TIGR01549 family)
MSNLGYLIFDLDGTILNNMEVHGEIFSNVLEAEGIGKKISKKHYLSTAGQSLNKQFQVIIKRYNPNWQGNLDELTEEFNRQLSNHVKTIGANTDSYAFEDSMTCIPMLKDAGYNLIISSSGSPDLIKEKLQVVELYDYFDIILGADEKQGLKKGKSHFNKIKDFFEISDNELKNNAVFVGDGIHDIQVAQKAKIISIGRTGTYDESTLERTKPDFIIESLHDLVWLLTDRSAFNSFRHISLLKSEQIRQNYHYFRKKISRITNLSLKNIDAEEFELIKIEYASLRNEILNRIQIRHQIMSLHLIAAGTFLSFGSQPNIPAVVLLVYPILTMFMAGSWARNDNRVKYIGSYIRDYLEIYTNFVLWETHRLEKDVNTGFLWLSRLRIFSTMGLFLLTQILALGIAYPKLSYSPEEIVLLSLDFPAIAMTLYFSLLRRGV